MGPFTGLLSLMPGVPKEMRDAKVDDRDVGKVEAIICSMTPLERTDPTVLDGARRLRIAHGSGTSTTEVNNLLRQFREMQKMMRGVGPMAKLVGGGRPGKPSKSSKGNRKKVKGGRVTPSSRGLGPAR
jgi:signal recognition particle subunit SRP54